MHNTKHFLANYKIVKTLQTPLDEEFLLSRERDVNSGSSRGRGPQTWPFPWLRPQHDGSQPGPAHLVSPHHPSIRTTRVYPGEHASVTQSKTSVFTMENHFFTLFKSLFCLLKLETGRAWFELFLSSLWRARWRRTSLRTLASVR